MKNKAILTLIFSLIFITSVFTASAVDIGISNVDFMGLIAENYPGATVTGSLEINNLGSELVTVNVPDYNLTDPNTGVQIKGPQSMIPQFDVNPGREGYVIIRYIIPFQLAATYYGNFTAIATNASGQTDTESMPFNMTIRSDSSLHLAHDGSSVEGNTVQGATYQGSFVINNTRNSDITANITATNLTNGSNILQVSVPDQFDFTYLSENTVDFQVPVSFTAELGLYTGQITVEELSGETIVIPVSLNVTEFTGDIEGKLEYSGSDIEIDQTNGTIYDGSFKINNTGYVNNIGNISATNLTSGSNKIGFDIDNQIEFQSRTETDVPFTINIPSGAQDGVYTGVVTIKQPSGDDIAINVNLNVSVPTTPPPPPADSAIIDIATYTDTNPLRISFSETGKSKTSQFVVKKTGTLNVPGVGFSYNAAEFTDSNGNYATLSFSPSTLTVDGDETITVNASVPSDLAPGNYDGLITASNGSVSTTFMLKIEITNFLEISVDVSDDEVKPGEEFTVTVTVDNTANDIDLEDVEVKIEIMDGSSVVKDEDNDKLEDDDDMGSIDADDEEEVEFTFTTPLDAEDRDDYTVKITVTAENADDNTITYSLIDEEESIDVVREDHELVFDKLNFRKSTLDCRNRYTYLDIIVRNTGSSDEDTELLISGLDIGLEKSYFFELDKDYDDEDNDNKISELIAIDETLAAGTYNIEVTAYYHKSKSKVRKTVPLVVGNCQDTSSSDTSDNQDTDSSSTDSSDSGSDSSSTSGSSDSTTQTQSSLTIVNDGAVAGITGVPPTIIRSKSNFSRSPLYMALLAFGNIILLMLIAMVTLVLVKKYS
ncbi:hypothetical protein ACFL0W_05805 [Nanoarchaeota archaeon]